MEFLQRVGDRVHHPVIPPDADVHGLPWDVWDEVHFDVLVEWDVGDLDVMLEQRNASVAVDLPCFTQANTSSRQV